MKKDKTKEPEKIIIIKIKEIPKGIKNKFIMKSIFLC